MNKKDALKVLLIHSFLFSNEVKDKLLLKLEVMDDNQIDILGKFLASEKIKAIENGPDIIESYEDFLSKLS